MLVFRLLGRLEVRSPDGGLLPLGRRKQRALLAMLLLRAGTIVRVDEMIEAIWNGRPPEFARANLQSYVSGLRQALKSVKAVPVKDFDGYRLDVAPEECDVPVFEGLAAEGRRALEEGHHAQAVERLTRALALWRGPLLEDLAEFDWITPHVARLAEARLAATEDQVEARLALGGHAELTVELAATVREHPLRERSWSQYLRALHRSGERARALSAYETMREMLWAELRVEPGQALKDLHRDLRDDVMPAENSPADVVPAMLPPAVADFTGRQAEVRRLRAQLTPAPAPAPIGLTVAGITGMAGVGKTTLAVHVAHAIAEKYPGGQLFANLAGAGAAPLAPADVLGRFLRALGVPPLAVPADPDERAELYRTVLAGRPALVVLDNAASEAQVRPLLPGTASCAVLVTGRQVLSGLEGARWTELDVLPADEGVRLLGSVVGDSRTADQPDDAEAIVSMCGGLPLAVRVAGARLASRPRWPLSHLVAQLRDEHRRLDRLGIGDLRVRASLGLSYDGLSPSAQRLFRLLGSFDVPDFPGWLAAELAGGPTEDLEVLLDAHLLSVVGTDAAGQVRYRFHDLVRLFARDQSRQQETPVELDAVLRRGFGAWLAVAERLEPGVPGACVAPIPSRAQRPDVSAIVCELAGVTPLAWFDAEHPSLRAAIRQACDAGYDELAFDLAQRMEKYFDVRGMYAEWEPIHRKALAACQAAGNLRGEAVMTRGLLDLTTWVAPDNSSEAMARMHEEAIRLEGMFRTVSERGGMADAAVMRSWALTAMGRHTEAIDAATESLDWAQEAAHLGGVARAHVALAVAYGESAHLLEAAGHLYEALPAARELGNPRYEATVLQFLGIAHSRAGNFEEAQGFLNESLEISRRHQDAYTETLSMITLARLHLGRDDADARPVAEAALAVAREYRLPHHIADALVILGELELNAGRAAEAATYLRESVALWRTRGWLTFLAAALMLLGRALLTLDPDEATAALQEAVELFTRAGDTAKAEQAVQLLHSSV